MNFHLKLTGEKFGFVDFFAILRQYKTAIMLAWIADLQTWRYMQKARTCVGTGFRLGLCVVVPMPRTPWLS